MDLLTQEARVDYLNLHHFPIMLLSQQEAQTQIKIVQILTPELVKNENRFKPNLLFKN
jgi:hypothetical protein